MSDIPFPEGTRLAAYLRDSGGSAQELSVLQQEKAVGEWAKHNSIIISRIFKDIARSGLKVAGRDSFLEMLDYLDGHTPETGIVIWEYSRFSRDIDDAQFFLADLRRRGYSVYSLNDTIPAGLDGRLLESILTWKNAKFSEDLRRNVIRGLKYVASIHHAWFGHAPIGYVKVEKTIGSHRDGTAHTIHYLEIDPHTAPLVAKAFSMRSQGSTYSEIHRATHIFPWLQTYGKILQNEIYTGNYHNELWEIKEFCPAIIDMDTWNKVKIANSERREMSGYNHPRAVRSRYLLSGLMHCGKCGLKMNGMSLAYYKNRYSYYVCIGRSKTENKCTNRYIRKDEIEPRVINAVKTLLLDDKMLTNIYEEVRALQLTISNMSNAEQTRLKDDLRNIDQSIHRVISAIKDAGHSSAMLKSLSELERRKSELEIEIACLDVPAKVPDIDIMKAAAYIRDELDNAESQKLVELLRSIVIDIRAIKDDKMSGKIECRLPDMGDRTIFIDM